MCPLQTCRDASAWIAACVHDVFPIVMLGLIQECFNTGLREAPCTCIQRLFLCPHDCLSIGVLVEILSKLSPREGVQLFDAGDGSLVVLVLSAMFVKSDIDLT